MSAPAAAAMMSLGGCGIGTAVQSTGLPVVSAAIAPPQPATQRAAGIRATAGPQSTSGQMCAVLVDRSARTPAVCAHCAP